MKVALDSCSLDGVPEWIRTPSLIGQFRQGKGTLRSTLVEVVDHFVDEGFLVFPVDAGGVGGDHYIVE